ncbi:hypothetical protein BH11BAC2_BH11BAC2_25550 [soil metagenome]
MKLLMCKLISGILLLVMVVGSISGIYSTHFCLSVKQLNVKGLAAVSPLTCTEGKEDCCQDFTAEKDESCCLNNNEVNGLLDKQFTSSALIIPDQHPACCVKISGFFGIPVFKTALQNFGDYLQLFPSFHKENLFLIGDVQRKLTQNNFFPSSSGTYHQYQSFLQVFQI